MDNIIQSCYCDLIDVLPMDDARFRSKLYSAGLLPGNLKEEVKSKPTQADKAEHFLDNGIKRDDNSFKKLVKVMAEWSDHAVKGLANQIQATIDPAYIEQGGQVIVHPPVMVTVMDDVRHRLQARYRPSTGSDDPHCYIQLALIKQSKINRHGKQLNEITKLTLQGHVDEILEIKEPLNGIKDIFYHGNMLCPRLILILGAPGIGKSTLADEICFKWAHGSDFLATDFRLVILIPLRALQELSLKDKMLDVIGESVYVQLVKSLGSKCLIILEGLDEVSLQWQKSDKFFVQMIKEKSILEEAKILITSRPHALVALYSDSKVQKDARRIEIVGFSKQRIKEYVEQCCTNPERSKSFMDQLERFPNISSMCYVPLCLKMIVQSFKHNHEIFPDLCTLTEIYHSFIIHKLQNRGGDINLATLNDADGDYIKKLFCVFSETPEEALRTIYLLSKLSYNSYFQWCSTDHESRSPKIIYTNKELSQCNIIISSESDAHGLLKATHVLHGQVFTTSDDVVYNFNHLSIQEYLCGLYISLLPEDEQVQLFEEYFSDFPHMWPFYFGITKCKSPKILQSLLRIVWSTNQKDKVSSLRCIYEAQVPAELCGCIAQASLNVQELPMLPYDCLTASYFMSIVPVMRLTLVACSINDQAASMLFKYKSLLPQNVMIFDRNRITNKGMEAIASSTVNKVTHISFSANFWNDGGIRMSPATLSCLTCLVELDISNCYMESNSAIQLGNFLAINTSLLSLNMSCTHVKCDGIVPISHALQQNHTLVQLIANDCRISYKGALSIRDMLKVNNGLKYIKLDSNPFGADGVVAITEALPSNRKLTRLNLNGSRTQSSKSSVRVVCTTKKRSLDCSVLKVMFLGNNDFSNQEIKCIITESLSHLMLAAIGGFNSAFDHILGLTQLRELALGCCYLDTCNVIALADYLKVNTVLQALNICHNIITDEGIAAITDALQTNISLLHLTMLNCLLRSKGAKCISEMLKVNSRLHSLIVPMNKFGDDDIVAIAESLCVNNTLAKLEVGCCKIEDTGLFALKRLLNTTNSLKELNIQGNKPSQVETLIRAAYCNPGVQCITADHDQLDPSVKMMLDSVNSRKQKMQCENHLSEWIYKSESPMNDRVEDRGTFQLLIPGVTHSFV